MSNRPRQSRWLLWLLGAAIAGVVVVVVLIRWWSPQSSPENKFPVPQYSASRFLNTRPNAHSIGTAACAECHRANHESYLLTAHSRALADVDPTAEPPDGSFDHRASGRSYRVYRQDNQLRHEEVLRTEDGQEIGRVDVAVRYLVGSGNFCRTYLVEVDGFLQESPLTWYTARKKWDMSPGYDFPQHWSFNRPITVGCLACHSGGVEEAEGTVHRLTLHEKAIGCESCHGPGSLHRDLHQSRKLAPGEEDLTIVHPAKLSRPLQEAICATCHLNGPAAVQLRGRSVTDFRPGTPLSDYHINYRFKNPDEKMTVVGHVEQLHMSACYQKSQDMTCLTCHDPHQQTVPKDKTAFYRQKCLDCHTTHPCSLDEAQRLAKDAADNCMACHMPRGDTDIPHIAFTHHRIGRHPPQQPPRPPAAPSSGGTPELVPIEDVSQQSALDQQRNLGFANLTIYRDPNYSRYREVFRERARSLLEAVRAAGLREGETTQALAEIYSGTDLERAGTYAKEALEAKDLPPYARAGALMVLAQRDLENRYFPSAAGLLEQIVLLRREPGDWQLLGDCYLEQKQPAKALPLLQKALAIRPYRHLTHAALAEAYRQLGDLAHAREHQEKARWLFVHRQE